LEEGTRRIDDLFSAKAEELPAGFKSDGLPFGVTLVSLPFHDDALAIPAAAMHAAANCGAGRAGEKIVATPVPVPSRKKCSPG
jgi:allophanate hydrolase